jgi:hypothetical protein
VKGASDAVFGRVQVRHSFSSMPRFILGLRTAFAISSQSFTTCSRPSSQHLTSRFEEGSFVVLRPQKKSHVITKKLVGPLRPDKHVGTAKGPIAHTDIIGKRPRELVRNQSGMSCSPTRSITNQHRLRIYRPSANNGGIHPSHWTISYSSMSATISSRIVIHSLSFTRIQQTP